MINILPIEDKKEIKKDYLERLFIVTLVFFIVTLVMAVVMILPTILFLDESEKVSQENLAYVNKRLDEFGISQVKPVIDDLNKKLQILGKPSGFQKHSDTLREITNAGVGIKISSISIKTNNKAETVFISGRSGTRKDLLAFIDNLKRCKAEQGTQCTPFTKVVSPVSNLLKEKDIDFSINAEVVSTVK